MIDRVHFWTVAIGLIDVVLLAAVVHSVIGDIRRTLKKHSG